MARAFAHPLLNDLPCVEPRKRMVGGRFGWAIHRFPIKGGKTLKETVWREYRDTLATSVSRPNSLFTRLHGTKQ